MSLRTRARGLVALAAALCLALAGCQAGQAADQGQGPDGQKEKVRLVVKTPPIGLGNVPGVGEAEVYDLLVAAADKFAAQYEDYDVEFEISRYDYLDEQEQLVDKRGTSDAVDVFYAGSYNVPAFAKQGWLVPLDDVVDEGLRADIDETVWQQNTIDGKVYTLPFQQLQNTLMVNKQMMEDAGLGAMIPDGDEMAHWTTEEFDTVVRALRDSLDGQHKFAFMMYAANNQGDNHIMTLLRSQGSGLFDEQGGFAVNTPEGVAALAWLKQMDEEGITPKGAENMELLDCMNLFHDGRLAICVGNLTNLWDAWNRGLDVFTVNFPSQDGNGYCTASTNGFCVFDNGDAAKVKVAKDFVRSIYDDEELMAYTLGTLPVNRSVIEQHQDDIRMIRTYGDNMPNAVDNIRSRLGWQHVRDAFYPNIQDLLMGEKTPAEVAAAIDESCNAALELGRAELE